MIRARAACVLFVKKNKFNGVYFGCERFALIFDGKFFILRHCLQNLPAVFLVEF